MSVFSILKPQNSIPLVFDSPHSGRNYPDDFGYGCDFKNLRLAEDHYVDELFANAPGHGASFLQALFPRSYIDPNRAENDIDLNLLAGDWPEDIIPSARADAGIGLVRRLVRPGIAVYDRTLSITEIQARIEHYYRPYHAALKELLDAAHYNFGMVYHINCHSMPHETARPKRGLTLLGGQPRHADFTLGNRDGATASVLFTHDVRAFLQGLGYYVTINDPFKGVECVERYGAPARGRHSLQLEVNKSLYMDEETGEKSANFPKVQADITALIRFCADYARAQLKPMAAD